MTIEKDLNIVLELLEASRASVCGLRQHRQHAWDRFENAAGEFFEDHGPALLSALADQRRYRALVHGLYCDEAVHVGEAMVIFKVVGGCPTEQEFDAAMDELASIVPLDQEGE